MLPSEQLDLAIKHLWQVNNKLAVIESRLSGLEAQVKMVHAMIISVTVIAPVVLLAVALIWS